MSAARVAGRAGVSRKTFYDVFSDREDCFLAVFDEAAARATGAVKDAAAGVEGWKERVRAGLSALLVFLGDEPGLGALLVVDVLSAGPSVLARRAKRIETLTGVIHQGRTETKPGEGPPPLTAEGVVGAVLSVLHARMLERDGSPLLELLNPLMAMIVHPYLGPAAARKELARPTPKAPIAAPRPVRYPLEDLEMRITYRTLRVLAALAALPGGSNREIAIHAGIFDQGQISRLLARLQRLQLVENTGHGPTRGETNAWTLTAKGREVQQATEIDTRQTTR
jgi:AcrR family transcriptional regulator